MKAMQNDYRLLLSNATMLLVEDNDRLRQEFRDVLSLYIGTIYEADSGRSALKLFHKHRVNIIFSDVKMPDMNGLELVKKVREYDSSVPIVIISAYTEPEVLIDFIQLGLVQYIVKPISHTKLIETLEACAMILATKSLLFFDIDDDSHYDRNKNMILHKEGENELTVKERSLLELLIDHHGTLVSKSMIQSEVYEERPMSDAALKNLMMKLRKKLQSDAVETVGSSGYLLQKR